MLSFFKKEMYIYILAAFNGAIGGQII